MPGNVIDHEILSRLKKLRPKPKRHHGNADRLFMEAKCAQLNAKNKDIVEKDLRRRSQQYFNKNQEVMCHFEPLRTDKKCLNGTEGRGRTDTMSPSPDFESGASTNSATPAHYEEDYNRRIYIYKVFY